MGDAEIRRAPRAKSALRAFRGPGSSAAGWYVGSVLLREVHDEGSHGKRALVWTNFYLIQAPDPERAYLKALQIGGAHEGSPGSHTCGEEKAHWEFVGLSNLIPVAQPPGPGSLLWCERASCRGDPRRELPERSALGVFVWEEETQARVRSGGSAQDGRRGTP